MKLTYRADIDGLRAIAIIFVIAFHLDESYLSGGFIGVDIFFVISGFLITYIIKNEVEKYGAFDFKNFYIKRARRLLPALFATILSTAIVAILFLSPSVLASFGGSATASTLSISNFFFWTEAGYFDVSAKLKPLLHTWSLSIEEQFYIFWPVLLVFLLKIRNSVWLFLTIGGLFVVSIFINVFYNYEELALLNKLLSPWKEYLSNEKATIFYLLPFRVFEFMIGVMLVWLGSYTLKRVYLQDILFLLGLFLVFYSAVVFHKEMLWPSWYGIVPTLGTALLIYSSKSRLQAILTNKYLVGVGLISYSLYLVHWPIIVFYEYLAENITYTDQLLIVLSSFILAFLSYRFIEQPFRQQHIRCRKHQKTLTVSTLLLFVVGGYICIIAMGGHGE